MVRDQKTALKADVVGEAMGRENSLEGGGFDPQLSSSKMRHS
jgi:hypothetical protein